MKDTVQMNVNVRPETREKLAEVTKATLFRFPGQTVDWLVSEAWQRLQVAPVSVSSETVSPTVDQAVS